MRKWISACAVALAALFLVPEQSIAQSFNATSPAGKRKVRRRRKVPRKRRPRSTGEMQNSAGMTGVETGDSSQADDQVAKPKSSFGVVGHLGYGMFFSDIESDSGKQSVTFSGLDASALFRYKWNMGSYAVPVDAGFGYITRGYSQKDANSGATTDVTYTVTSLSLGSGIEFKFGPSSVPAMLYFDYGLSNSGKAGNLSVNNVFDSVYRLKLQSGYIYSLGMFNVGGILGGEMFTFATKANATTSSTSKSNMGVYGGLHLGAEF